MTADRLHLSVDESFAPSPLRGFGRASATAVGRRQVVKGSGF
jgi:hypothetical protein